MSIPNLRKSQMKYGLKPSETIPTAIATRVWSDLVLQKTWFLGASYDIVLFSDSFIFVSIP